MVTKASALDDQTRGEIPLEGAVGLSREAFDVNAEDGSFFEVDAETAGIEEQGCGTAEEGFVRYDQQAGLRLVHTDFFP